MNSSSASFQWGMGGNPHRRNIRFSSRELRGRGAGRGKSWVVQGTISCSYPPRRKISRANSAQVASPSQVRWKVPANSRRSSKRRS